MTLCSISYLSRLLQSLAQNHVQNAVTMNSHKFWSYIKLHMMFQWGHKEKILYCLHRWQKVNIILTLISWQVLLFENWSLAGSPHLWQVPPFTIAKSGRLHIGRFLSNLGKYQESANFISCGNYQGKIVNFFTKTPHLGTYSHLSNNRGGWNKRLGVQKLQNQLLEDL